MFRFYYYWAQWILHECLKQHIHVHKYVIMLKGTEIKSIRIWILTKSFSHGEFYPCAMSIHICYVITILVITNVCIDFCILERNCYLILFVRIKYIQTKQKAISIPLRSISPLSHNRWNFIFSPSFPHYFRRWSERQSGMPDM